MAVLGRLLVSSAERLDLPDFLSIDSYIQGDFKFLLKSFVGGDNPFVLKGFDVINPGNAIGTQNISVRVADSVVYYPGSLAGPFFFGLEEGNTQSAPLVPELRKNATNYVYLTLTTTEAAKDTRAFWDPDKEAGAGGEFTQDVNTQTVLSVDINVSVSSFPENTIPVCKVIVGANFISSIEDARDMMFRLGQGGLNPDPLARFNWRENPTSAYERSEPNTLMTSALDPNPFQGGDKNIQNLKEWMDAVMTKLAELGGTTYWYEDTSVFNLINVFKDTLTSSIKSKGFWNSSDLTPGMLTWSEDIVLQSTADLSDVILRSGNKTLANDEVMYVDRVRDQGINSGSISVNWFNSANYVNGQLGSFENLSKGDWIKKADDIDNLYLRVEEFYAAASLGGGVTAPGNALSVRLSANYAGVSESKQGSYIKGVYLSSEINVANRADAAIQLAAGNFYWLAMRSDTILNTSDITTTQLTFDISGDDGTKARCDLIGHGLNDGQRITISGSTNFDGTFAVSKETDDIFYINTAALSGPHSDEVGVSGFYATVTTAATDNGFSLQLESANHGLSTDQRVVISGTTNYNGDFQVFPTGNTTYTIPVNTLIANETTGIHTGINIYVKTDIGPTKLERGENKAIGEIETENLMSFIGMDNDAQTSPNYYVGTTYNTLYAQENYNASPSDNLTQRVSKLTSMMADKTQDKVINKSLVGVKQIANITNLTNQEITFIQKDLSNPMTLVLSQPSSVGNCVLTFDSTISLGANQAAYIEINRNEGSSLMSSSDVVVTNISEVPLNENVFIVLFRLSGTGVHLWDGNLINDFLNATGIAIAEVTTITPVADISGSLNNKYFNINSASDETEYYVWLNVNGAGVDPLIAGKTGIEVAIATNDTANTIATAIQAVVDVIGDFSAVDNTGSVTITNTEVGDTTDATAETSGFSITIDTQGVGEALHYIANGDLDKTAIKKLDKSLFDGLASASAGLDALKGSVNQNANLKMVAGGVWSWNIGSTNEVQSFVFDIVPTSGTWDIFDGSDTATGIAFNASNTTIKAAIEAAFVANATTVNVTGDYTTGIVVEITSSNLGTNNYPQMITTNNTDAGSITDGTVQVGIDPVNELILSQDAYIQIPGLDEVRNTISAQTINLNADGEVAYVEVNRTAGIADVRSVTVADAASIVLTDDMIVIARRIGDDIIVGTSSFTLADGERLELDAALAEINRYFGQLRMIPHPVKTQRVLITGADVTKLNNTVISQAVKNLLLNFNGAEVDFQTGKVLASDGFTPLGIDFTPIIPVTGQFRWLSVTLSPGAVNADNTINGQLIVLSGSADGVSKALAIKPAFSKGTQLGMVAITSADGINVSSITAADIVQLGVGGGGSGGEGDANELLERVKNRLDNGQYDVVTPIIFSTSEESLSDPATTASYDVANALYTFPLGTEQFTSTQMLDPVFLSEGKDVIDVELSAYWDLDNLDATATYEVSRNGGADYQTVVMSRIGQSDTFYATHVFADTETLDSIATNATENSDIALTDLILKRAQAFTVSSQTTLKQLTISANVLGTVAGNICIQVINDNGGLPSEDVADLLFESTFQDISGLSAGDNDITVPCTIAVPAGTYHLVVLSDLEYRDSYNVGVDEFRIRANSADITPDSTEFISSPWVASTAGKLMFLVEGRVLDLRLRVTGSVADANLLGLAVFYDRDGSFSIISQSFDRQLFIFSGDDNLNTFTVTDFIPDPILMTGYEIGTGQAYRRGAWSLNGVDIEFPPNTFNKPGEVITLEFFQMFKGSMQFDSRNRALLAENHLGSQNGSQDLSVAGRGIILRRPDGTLRELTINDADGIDIKSVP